MQIIKDWMWTFVFLLCIACYIALATMVFWLPELIKR